MGALSAVGAFEVFGNTLRFLFLPSALNVLDLLLDFQSVVMGMDRSTRETIGNFALLAAGFAVVVGLLAALGKAVVTLVGALKTLAVASKIIIPLFQLFNTAIGTVFGLMMGLAGLLAGIAGGFLVVTRVAAKFGKKVAAVVGLILAAIGTVLAVILSAPLAVGAAIGLIIGSILGLAFVFRDTLLKIVVGTFKAIMGAIDFLISGFMGLIDFIVNDVVGGFVELFNKLVGNSIIPEMVRKIIGFIMSIPGKIANLGIQIVKTIVNGITSAGSAIFEAFKSILPDFLVNAIEGAGKAVKGIADAGGKIVDAAGNVIKGAAEAGSNLLGGGNKNSGQNKTEITNNQIDVTAEVNNSEETVGETGTKLGQSLNQTFEGKRGRREL
jgi:phage-related protein